jgi:hypothetical protein
VNSCGWVVVGVALLVGIVVEGIHHDLVVDVWSDVTALTRLLEGCP